MRLLFKGEWTATDRVMEVCNPYDGSVIDTVPCATAALARDAVDFADRYDYRLTAWQRYEILNRVYQGILADGEALARLIAEESGKTVKDARLEIRRSAQTFLFAAEEAKRITGDILDVDAAANMPKRMALTLREPVGVVVAISPFNYPLNLVAHKVGPAIAANNPVVLKPASSTPLTALRLAEICLEAGLPAEMLQVITGPGSELGDALITHPACRKVTFTGSVPVGKAICAKVGLKAVCMELGGNDPLIVLADADLDKAVPVALDGAFGNNGERCTSIKRLIIEDAIADYFIERFVVGAKALVAGNQMDPAVDIGPLIDEDTTIGIETRIQDAVAQGADLLCGGERQGAIISATVLDHVPPNCGLVTEETFGPVAPILRVTNYEEAIAVANGTPFGLQSGIFTNDLSLAMDAMRRLRAGAVMINRGPGFRAEHLAFGGVKDSGIGREGVRYAVEAMTTLKTVVM
jgi:putative phosphonoacetaldehyde dehydrogenase